MHAALYARFSSDRQREASIEDQFRNCEQFASRNDFDIIDRFKDCAMSGASIDRPGYQSLLANAESKKFDVLLVDDLSRLSRDQIEVERLRRKFQFWGIRLIGVSDGIDTAAKGHRLQTGVRGLIDELYLEDLKEKTHRGLFGQAEKGFSCGGRSYGYCPVPIEDKNKSDQFGKPIIRAVGRRVNPDQATWVRQIFTWYAEGFSPRWIAAELNRRKIPSPRNSTWSASALHGDPEKGTGLLNNPLYIGKYIWNRSRWDRHPDTKRRFRRIRSKEDWVETDLTELQIIPQELWDAVKKRQAIQRQKSLATRESLTSTNLIGRGPKYIFSGLLKCGVCSKNYVVTSRYQYGCSTRINRGESVCPNPLRVSRQILETKLLHQIKSDLLSPDGIELFIKETSRLLKHETKNGNDNVGELKKQLATVQLEITNIMDAIKAGFLGEITAHELRTAEAKKTQLELRLKKEVEGKGAIQKFLPGAREKFLTLVQNLENIEPERLEPIRNQIKTLVGGEITLHPTDQGYLEAEISGDYAGFLNLSAEESKIIVVAGEGFEPSTFGL